jgi:hypothetical protein
MASAKVIEMILALRDRASRRGKDDPEFVRWDDVFRDAKVMTNRELLRQWPEEMLSVMPWSERRRLEGKE